MQHYLNSLKRNEGRENLVETIFLYLPNNRFSINSSMAKTEQTCALYLS